MSCFEATSHGVWLKSFIFRLRVVDSISRPLKIYCDNSNAVFMAKNNKVAVKTSTSTSSI